MEGDAAVVPLATVLMNRLRGLQAATIGWPYQYPAGPMTGCSKRCPPGPGLPTLAVFLPGLVKYAGHPGVLQWILQHSIHGLSWIA
eukprot:2079202-Heterocapsa_arctica.AAC.1